MLIYSQAGSSPYPAAVNVCCVHIKSLQKYRAGIEREFCPYFMKKIEKSIKKHARTYILPLQSIKTTLNPAGEKYFSTNQQCLSRNL